MRDLHVLGCAEPGKVDQAVGIARNYDELVDSPAELGTFQQSAFQQDGATYHVVVDGDPAPITTWPSWIRCWRRSPTPKSIGCRTGPSTNTRFSITFRTAMARAAWSTLTAPRSTSMPIAYAVTLMPVANVTAHEFFHLWNVKRIRPQSLEPIDYQHENDTRALWFSEGVTSTVGDLMLARAGLIDETEYLQRVTDEITELQGRPAHRWQSAEESSLDAWFEGNAFYRSPERSISYYNKGEILGILLDLRIRQLTDGRKSLRDLLHWMNEHYAKQHRFFPDSAGVEQAAETITGQSFDQFFRDYVAGVKEIPYDDFFRSPACTCCRIPRSGDGRIQYHSEPWRSAGSHRGGSQQRRPARRGDCRRSRHAINGKPADAYLEDELSRLLPGATVHLELENRRGRREVELRLGVREEQSYELRDLAGLTSEQRAHRSAWIHGEDETRGAH